MKPHHYLAILFRLFAIALTLYAVKQFPFLAAAVSEYQSGINASFSYAIAATLVPMLAALLIWYFPVTLAASILRPGLDETIEALAPQPLLALLLCAIGVFTFYYALVDLAYYLTFWHLSSRVDYGSAYVSLESKANMIATLIEFLLAMLILFKAKSLAAWLLVFSR